jgi:pyruvate/2-oxoglutarate dehydrogenase complex dihydrolipoamide dehydrogenase (E3) component
VTEGLGLSAAGVRTGERGPVVTGRHLATTAPGIYAAGDVTGLMPFTHAAYAMGRIAARNALRKHWQPPVQHRRDPVGCVHRPGSGSGGAH